MNQLQSGVQSCLATLCNRRSQGRSRRSRHRHSSSGTHNSIPFLPSFLFRVFASRSMKRCVVCMWKHTHYRVPDSLGRASPVPIRCIYQLQYNTDRLKYDRISQNLPKGRNGAPNCPLGVKLVNYINNGHPEPSYNVSKESLCGGGCSCISSLAISGHRHDCGASRGGAGMQRANIWPPTNDHYVHTWCMVHVLVQGVQTNKMSTEKNTFKVKKS